MLIKDVLKVDLIFRLSLLEWIRFAFRGRCGEPPRRYAPVGSPLLRIPAGVFAYPLQSTAKFNRDTMQKICTMWY